MKIFDEVVILLKKPFPIYETSMAYYRILLFLSVFITLFLYIFEPFGISTLESNKFLICLGFGSMTFLGAFLYEILVHKLLRLRGRLQNWTYGKWMLDNLGIMLFISLANFLFARLALFGFIQWNLFPTMLYSTFMIGIIPLAAIGAFSLLKFEKKYQNIAKEINRSGNTSSIYRKSHKGSIFDIHIDQIRYIEALQNYAKIGYISPEGETKSKIERTTLKHILKETEGTTIIKCHRSFLVNKDTIISAAGNAQGLLLSLADCDRVIPVSRTYVPKFRTS